MGFGVREYRPSWIGGDSEWVSVKHGLLRTVGVIRDFPITKAFAWDCGAVLVGFGVR